MKYKNLLGKAVGEAGRRQDPPQHDEQNGGALRKKGLEGAAEKVLNIDQPSLLDSIQNSNFPKVME